MSWGGGDRNDNGKVPVYVNGKFVLTDIGLVSKTSMRSLTLSTTSNPPIVGAPTGFYQSVSQSEYSGLSASEKKTLVGNSYSNFTNPTNPLGNLVQSRTNVGGLYFNSAGSGSQYSLTLGTNFTSYQIIRINITFHKDDNLNIKDLEKCDIKLSRPYSGSYSGNFSFDIHSKIVNPASVTGNYVGFSMYVSIGQSSISPGIASMLPSLMTGTEPLNAELYYPNLEYTMPE